MHSVHYITICIAILAPIIECLNIVVFLPGTTDGERQPLNKLAQELAFRNHAVCTFKGILIPEVKYLVNQRLHLVRELKLNLATYKELYDPLKEAGKYGPWAQGYDLYQYQLPFWKAHVNACESILNSDLMDRLRDDLYDVAVVYAGNPCHLAIVQALSIPFIYFDTTGFSDDIVMASGMPSLPGLIPSSESTYSQAMNIEERAQNLWHQAKAYIPFTNVSLLMEKFSPRWVHMDAPISAMFQNASHLKDRFPYFLNVNEIKQKAALYFVSSDPIVEFQGRPDWPNIIHVGGMHIETARPLFEPYTTTNNNHIDGVVILSFGNFVDGSSMPAYLREAFLEAFRKLPDIQVYWRISTTSLPDTEPDDIPPNVNATQFVPQNDLLADKSIKLLINHGGISSVMEAVHYGVPVLGIPLYGPNYNNLRKIEALGMAKILDKNTVTKEILYETIKELIYENKYRTNAKQVSRIYKDRPMTPFETALHWVEFVGRHHGAQYLDPVVPKNMPLYKYLLLDIIATVAAASYVTITFLRLIFGKLFKLCSKSDPQLEERPSRLTETKRSTNSPNNKGTAEEKAQHNGDAVKKTKKKAVKSE